MWSVVPYAQCFLIRPWIEVGMFLVIKTGFNFPQTFADSGFKKELMETALLLNELCSCLSESVRTGMLSWCACAETHFADVSQSVAAILISETRTVSTMLPETLLYCPVTLMPNM